MGASRVDFHFEQSKFTDGRIDAMVDGVMRDGFTTSMPTGGHTSATNDVSGDWSSNSGMILLWPAVDESDISLLHFSFGKLRRQSAMRLVVFGNENKAAGFFVQAVYDAGAKLASDGRELMKMMQQRVY